MPHIGRSRQSGRLARSRQRFARRRERSVARLSGEGQLGIERIETACERSRADYVARRARHRKQFVGQSLARDALGDRLDIRLARNQPLQIEPQRRPLGIGQSAQGRLGAQRAPLAERHVAHVDLQVGHRAAHADIGIVQSELPRQQPRSEMSHVVGRDARVVQLALDSDVMNEILVCAPVVAAQGQRTQAHVGILGLDIEIAKVDKSAVDQKTSRKVAHGESAVLHSGEIADISAHHAAVEREIVDESRSAVQVHVAEIDSVFGVAMLAPLDHQRQIVYPHVAYPEGEFALLFLLFLVRESAHDLFYVGLAVGHLADVQHRVGYRAVAQHYARLARDIVQIDAQFPDIEQRVARVILDIESLHAQAAQCADAYAVDRHGGLQLARDVFHGAVDDKILYRRQIDYQREHNGAKYQKQ